MDAEAAARMTAFIPMKTDYRPIGVRKNCTLAKQIVLL